MNHDLFGLLLQEVVMAGTGMVLSSWCWWDGYLPPVHAGVQYLKAALKARLFNPQPRIKDSSAQAEGQVVPSECCHAGYLVFNA